MEAREGMQGQKNSPRDTFQNCVRAKGKGRERGGAGSRFLPIGRVDLYDGPLKQ